MNHRPSFNLKATQSIIKDTMKEYSGTSRDALLKYIVKQGDVFKSDQEIGKNATVKHLIVSSVHPESYSKLNPEQQESVRNATVSWAMERFKDYPFIGGIELNENKGAYNQEYLGGIREGFHAHIALSGFKLRGSIDVHALKEGLSNYIAENVDQETRTIIGIKNKSEIEEIRRQKISQQNKRTALVKLKSDPDFLQNNLEIQELQTETSKVFKSLNIKYSEKQDLASMNKHQRYALIQTKEALKKEISTVQRDISSRRNELKFIDKFVKDEQEKMSSVEKFFNEEYKELQHYYRKENLGFNYWADSQSAIYKKLANERVKNKEISPTQFLYEIAINKSYWAHQKSENRHRHERILRERRKEFKAKLFEMADVIRRYGRDRLFVASIVSMDRDKLNKKMAQYSEIGTKYNSHYDVFLSRIKTIDEELSRMRERKLKLAQSKTMKIADKRAMIQKVLAFDAQHCFSNGFEALTKGVQEKYHLEAVTHGKEKKTECNVGEKTIHISDKKAPSAFDDLVRGIVQITNIRETAILKSLSIKGLFKVIRQYIYKTHPQYKEALQKSDSIEGFFTMFDTLKTMSKTKPKVEENYGFEM